MILRVSILAILIALLWCSQLVGCVSDITGIVAYDSFTYILLSHLTHSRIAESDEPYDDSLSQYDNAWEPGSSNTREMYFS